MNGRGFGRAVLFGAGVILLVAVGWWLLKVVFALAFKLVIIAAVVLGGIYLFNKAKSNLNGTSRRR